jgi:transforming growth factor-beta-induced protein
MKKRPLTKLLALLFAGALVLAACGDDSDSDSSTAESGDTTETTEAAEEAVAELDIVDTAAGIEDFTTLVAAVDAADLVDTLKGEGPFTVFAPTNEAFETALADLGLTAEELLADTETLTSILTYHVVAGEVPAADVVTLDGEEVETVNGASVTITVDGDAVMVNDANVVQTDVFSSNGVIHVIDAVLVP